MNWSNVDQNSQLQPDEGVDEGSWDSHAKPGGQEPDERGHVLPDDVLDHLALKLGHEDGEEGSDDQHQGVKGEQTGLITPDTRNHDLGGSCQDIANKMQIKVLTFRRTFSCLKNCLLTAGLLLLV